MLRRALFIFAVLLLVTGAVPPTTKAEAAARRMPEEEAQAAHAADADDADMWSLQAIPPPRTAPGGGIEVDEPGQEDERGIDTDAWAGSSRVGRFTDYVLIVAATMGGAAAVLPTEWVAGATNVVAEWVDGESCQYRGRRHRQDS